MKKIFLLPLLLIGFLKIGFSQCIPNPSTGIPGFCPPASAFPCIERGQPFSGVIQFEYWDSVSSIFIQAIIFDSISNLPTGISYNVNPTNVNGGETACIELTGLTNDTTGTYLVSIYCTISIPGIGVISGEISEIEDNLIQLGLIDTSVSPPVFLPQYYLRIVNPGTPCPGSGLCQHEKNLVSGMVFFDENGNGIMDGLDNPMLNIRVDITPNSFSRFTNQLGTYAAFLDSGTFDVAVSPATFYTVSTPSSGSHSIVFNGSQLTSINNDFGLTPNIIFSDLSISLTTGFARPRFVANHWIHYQNIGTSIQSGTISYLHDPVLNFLSTTETPTSQNANNLTWNFSNLYPGQQRSIHIELQVPFDINLLGDTLLTFVNLSLPNDTNLLNNSDTSLQVVTGSYDPNDKQVSPDDVKNGVHPSQPLTYTVRFQNTGTDTAFTIVVRDTLDDFLNASSFQTIAASHPYAFQLEGGKYAIWTFDNILLPDSGIDEPSSHGFVKFSIGIKQNTPDETVIENSASIYFDFNPPIHTNTVQARIDLTSGIRAEELIQSSLFPNPASEIVTLTLSRALFDFDVQLLDLSGRVIQSLEQLSGSRVLLDAKDLENGIYFYRIARDNKPVSRGKLVVMR